MAAHDASFGGRATVSPLTYTHTPVGTPTSVVVWVGISVSTTLPTPGTISYGGQTMTLVRTVTEVGVMALRLYKLGSPPSGAQTVSIAWTGGAGINDVSGISMTFTGSDAATATMLEDDDGVTQVGDTPSLTLTSAVGGLVADGLAVNTILLTTTAGAGQTERIDVDEDQDATSLTMSASTEAGAASVTMTYTGSVGTTLCYIAVAVKNAGAGIGAAEFMPAAQELTGTGGMIGRVYA